MPVTRQTIAIIESRSTIGAAIARGVSTGNYRILLVNPDKKNERLVDELRSTHPEADVEMLDCSHTGCWEADTIVVSVPADEWEGISQKIEEVSTQKVVLGTVNNAEQIPADLDLQKSLPYSKVVEVVETDPERSELVPPEPSDLVNPIGSGTNSPTGSGTNDSGTNGTGTNSSDTNCSTGSIANGARVLELRSVHDDALETATRLLNAAGFKTIQTKPSNS